MKKLLSAVFVVTWFAILVIAGALEQGTLTYSETIISATVTFAVMGVSGFKSGLLVVPNKR